MTRWLILTGVALIGLGLAWPYHGKQGMGRLPGDIRIEREGFTLYLPITTSIIVSLALSLILWLFRK
jgi:hypothetical protein